MYSTRYLLFLHSAYCFDLLFTVSFLIIAICHVSISSSSIALPSSPVVNLEVCYTFSPDVNQSSILSVEVQWEAPLWPEGEVNRYDVLVNTTVVMANSSADIDLMSESVKVRVFMHACI